MHQHLLDSWQKVEGTGARMEGLGETGAILLCDSLPFAGLTQSWEKLLMT